MNKKTSMYSLSIYEVLSGAEAWEEIEDFAKEHESQFKKFLILPHGIPSHDTISRVFSALDPKALRGSKRVKECKKAFHIINAWSCANKICLGPLKVEDKSNEMTAVPELLKLLYRDQPFYESYAKPPQYFWFEA